MPSDSPVPDPAEPDRPGADASAPAPGAGATGIPGWDDLPLVDERSYRTLLRSAPLPAADVAERLGLPPEQAARLLARLADAGLVDVREGTVVAAAPGPTLERIIGERSRALAAVSQQLDSLRRLLPALEADYRAAHEVRGGTEQIRVITPEEVVLTLRSLAPSAQGELLWLRPDQWRFPYGTVVDRWVEELLARGRRSRVIYPARALEEAPEAVRARADRGEHVRVLAQLPGRLAVVGEAAALVPRRFDQVGGDVLVIEQPGLVSALTVLFESLWERAMVVPGIGAAPAEVSAGARRLLLDQLTRGAKDDQIARTLGLSLRTVRRRVAELMDELGAASRFQAGVEAVRRGWL